MGKKTGIAWVDSTFNLAWGCYKISPACKNCYAEKFSSRIHKTNYWQKDGPRLTFDDKHWSAPLKWNRQHEALQKQVAGLGYQTVFTSSMADVFEDHPVINQERQKLFTLIQQTPALFWLLLTKRPENIAQFLPKFEKPYRNWGLGVTVEDTDSIWRIPCMLHTPAPFYFVSCEPLLEDIFIAPYLICQVCGGITCKPGYACQNLIRPRKVSWVIAGGESAPDNHRRDLDINHVRSLRNQCRATNTAFFYKQFGGRIPDHMPPFLDGEIIQEFPAIFGKSQVGSPAGFQLT